MILLLRLYPLGIKSRRRRRRRRGEREVEEEEEEHETSRNKISGQLSLVVDVRMKLFRLYFIVFFSAS